VGVVALVNLQQSAFSRALGSAAICSAFALQGLANLAWALSALGLSYASLLPALSARSIWKDLCFGAQSLGLILDSLPTGVVGALG